MQCHANLLDCFGWCSRLCVFTCASALQICWDCGFAFPQRGAGSTHACGPGRARGSGIGDVCALIQKMSRSHHAESPAYSSQPQAKRLADPCGLWLSDCVPHAQICKSDWQITQALVREERAFALRVEANVGNEVRIYSSQKRHRCLTGWCQNHSSFLCEENAMPRGNDDFNKTFMLHWNPTA